MLGVPDEHSRIHRGVLLISKSNKYKITCVNHMNININVLELVK